MLEKIKESDLEGKGVIGQAEVPGLSALEMQKAVEQIVREIAIPKINEVIEYVLGRVATTEDLGNLIIEAGAVTSVFGRAGAVKPQSGDYSAEMVGAAAKKHSAEHASGGSDPITPENIGAANKTHSHGNITSDGKIGSISGKVLMTGASGKIEAKLKSDAGFVIEPTAVEESGNISVLLQGNKEYLFSEVGSLDISPETYEGKSHGFVTFGAFAPSISVTGFLASGGDDVAGAKASEVWEFSCDNGYIIWKNWSA